MSERYAAERADVLSAVRRIVEGGLVAGASGNVSRRIRTPDGDLIAITASRVPYHRFSADDVVVVDFEIDPVDGRGVPSSESLLHAAIYRARPDVGGVIHTHSVHASAFAVAGEPIPPILDEQVVMLGGAVEVADYGASASVDLAERAVAALGDQAAALLRHHGAVGVGTDLEEAVAVVELVERIAHIRAITKTLGSPRQLPDEVVAGEQRVYRMLRGMR
jgi:L-fuculose-phosphate aldolase